MGDSLIPSATANNTITVKNVLYYTVEYNKTKATFPLKSKTISYLERNISFHSVM